MSETVCKRCRGVKALPSAAAGFDTAVAVGCPSCTRVADCPTCEGTGFVFVWGKHGGPVANRCPDCAEVRKRMKQFDEALVPRHFWDAAWSDFERGEPGIRDAALMLRRRIDEGFRPGDAGVVLSGPPGLGKTTLSHIIAAELGVNLRQTSGPVLEKPKDLAAILDVAGDMDRFGAPRLTVVHRNAASKGAARLLLGPRHRLWLGGRFVASQTGRTGHEVELQVAALGQGGCVVGKCQIDAHEHADVRQVEAQAYILVTRGELQAPEHQLDEVVVRHLGAGQNVPATLASDDLVNIDRV